MMPHWVEPLEPRRLFSGGVDALFGSASGVAFTAPGGSGGVRDVAVDSAGNVLLGGSNDTGMLLERLNVNGQLDSRFGAGGVVNGTPRGLSVADFVVPLPSGGCIVADAHTFEQVAVTRFTANGRLDPTFGRNGVTRLSLNAQHVLLQPDGKIVVVGNAGKRDPDADANLFNYAVRLSANGLLDRSYGESGWASLGIQGEGDTFFFVTQDITSAFVDPAGRMVVAFELTDVNRDDFTDFNNGTVQLNLRRFTDHGTLDSTFGSDDDAIFESASVVFSQPMTGSGDPSEKGTALRRHDNHIVVVHRRDDFFTERPAFVSLVDSTGVVSSITAALGALAPSFHPNLSATVTADDSILLAGKKTSGATSTPALLKLDANLTLDSAFGSGGIMTLPNPGGQTETTQLQNDPDGRVLALAGNPQRIVRLFADDRPIVNLQRVRRDASNLRVTVSIRGTHPIDTTSVDDGDLRLLADGARFKLRLVNVVDNAGVVTANYRVSLGLLFGGTFSIEAVHDQLRDDHANANLTRDLGSVTLVF